MSEKTQHPQIITLVKIKGWYVPADSSTYKCLKGIGIPLLKIHADFIPTLEMQARPLGIRAKVTYFTGLRDDMLDKLGSAWKSKPGRNCSLNDHRLVFITKPSDASRAAISRVEGIFHKFCVRWGHSFESHFSETPTKLKLVIDYKFDPRRNPVISIEDQTQKNEMSLILGFTKITLTFQQKTVDVAKHNRNGDSDQSRLFNKPITLLQIYTQAANQWLPVHTATFADQNIGDPREFLEAMGHLFNRRQIATPGA